MKFQSEAITLFRQRKFRKITRRNGKENNALSTEMENTKIIICEKQVMHMLKCQEAEEKLIAFCHKHSLINMITFAYFILLLICCLGDSCDSRAPVPKGKVISITAQTWNKYFGGLIRDFPAARPFDDTIQQTHVGRTVLDNCGSRVKETVKLLVHVDTTFNYLDYFCNVNTAMWIMCKSMIWGDGCGVGGGWVFYEVFCASLTYQ